MCQCVFSVASEWRSQYGLISVLIFLQLQRYGLKQRYLWQLLWEISCYSELFVRRVSFERFDLSHDLLPIETLAFSLCLQVHLFCPSVSESLSSKTWDTKIPLSFCLCNSAPDPISSYLIRKQVNPALMVVTHLRQKGIYWMFLVKLNHIYLHSTSHWFKAASH